MVMAVRVTAEPLVMEVELIVKSVPLVPTVPSITPLEWVMRPQPAVPVATAVPTLGDDVLSVAVPLDAALKLVMEISTSLVPLAASLAVAGWLPVYIDRVVAAIAVPSVSARKLRVAVLNRIVMMAPYPPGMVKVAVLISSGAPRAMVVLLMFMSPPLVAITPSTRTAVVLVVVPSSELVTRR